MSTDAKCGLLVGVGLVLAAAVLFFQKDPPPPAPAASPAAALKPPAAAAEYSDRTPLPPARPVSRTPSDDFP